MFTPSASRQSAVPHLLDAARFPCFATGIFVDDNNRCDGRNVDRVCTVSASSNNL